MSLLPSSGSESESTQDGSLRLLDIDDDEADEVFETLSSKTTRAILAELHRTPRTPAELAEQTDTTVQNAMYHLEKLEDAGLARVTEIRYSSRGKEMRVYAPSEHPAVVFLGTDDRKSSLIAKLKRFLGAVGILGILGFTLELLETVGKGVGNHVLSPRTSLVAATSTFLALVLSSSSADDPTPSIVPQTRPEFSSMKRKTLLMTGILLASVCVMPVALAHSSAISGEYMTSTAPASTTGHPANAGVPDVTNETVTIVVTGGKADIQSGVSQQLAQTFRDRGATVEQADEIRPVSGDLFVVQLADSEVDAGRFSLTPHADLTAYFAYVETGNATVAESVLAHERVSDAGPPLFRTGLDGRAAVGSFSFERGNSALIDALNTIKRGGVDPEAFKRDIGATVANASTNRAFSDRLWT
ncbi:ArsR/SmtB family transcription factor [Halosimplex sp. J119]